MLRLVTIDSYNSEIGLAVVTNGQINFSVPVHLLEPELTVDSKEDSPLVKKVYESINLQAAYAIDYTFVVLSITTDNTKLQYNSEEFVKAIVDNKAVHVQLYEPITNSVFFLPVHMVEFV